MHPRFHGQVDSRSDVVVDDGGVALLVGAPPGRVADVIVDTFGRFAFSSRMDVSTADHAPPDGVGPLFRWSHACGWTLTAEQSQRDTLGVEEDGRGLFTHHEV